MLGYIMFAAAVLLSLSIGICAYREAYNKLTKVLSTISIALTITLAAAACTVCILIEKGVIVL